MQQTSLWAEGCPPLQGCTGENYAWSAGFFSFGGPSSGHGVVVAALRGRAPNLQKHPACRFHPRCKVVEGTTGRQNEGEKVAEKELEGSGGKRAVRASITFRPIL